MRLKRSPKPRYPSSRPAWKAVDQARGGLLAVLRQPALLRLNVGVFVLHAVQAFAVQFWHVVVGLPGRMRIELHADAVGDFPDLRFVRAAREQRGYLVVMLRAQHVALREGERVDGVAGHLVPVDQLLDHIVVHLERQHIADDLDIPLLLFGQPGDLRDVAEVVQVVRAELRLAGRIDGDMGLSCAGHGGCSCVIGWKHRCARHRVSRMGWGCVYNTEHAAAPNLRQDDGRCKGLRD